MLSVRSCRSGCATNVTCSNDIDAASPHKRQGEWHEMVQKGGWTWSTLPGESLTLVLLEYLNCRIFTAPFEARQWGWIEWVLNTDTSSNGMVDIESTVVNDATWCTAGLEDLGHVWSLQSAWMWHSSQQVGYFGERWHGCFVLKWSRLTWTWLAGTHLQLMSLDVAYHLTYHQPSFATSCSNCGTCQEYWSAIEHYCPLLKDVWPVSAVADYDSSLLFSSTESINQCHSPLL